MVGFICYLFAVSFGLVWFGILVGLYLVVIVVFVVL